ncbi:MAG: hypothetical protein KAU12_04125 [Candidatus Omnitrophica bacterium]|nr:hypothetical protein [Candidatus Omnitrophota bacterium]
MSENEKALPKEIKQYLKKGEEAFRRRNYDYAIELFSHALLLDVKLADTRNFLHLTKIKKFRENPPSFFSYGANKVKAQTYMLNAKKLEVRGRLNEALEEYEKALNFDPLNAKIFIKQAAVFLKLEMKEAALKTYQEGLSMDENNLEALKKLGMLYKDKKELNRSQNYYVSAGQLSPDDADVQKGLKDLAALKTIERDGWADQDTFRSKIRDIEEASKLEKETKMAKSDEDIDYLIQNLKEKLKGDPENTAMLFRLADYYKAKELFDEADVIYKKILTFKPNNEVALRNIENLKIKKIEKELSRLKQNQADDPENRAFTQKIDELERCKNNIHFERIKESVAKLPSDMSLRYNYGLLLKERRMFNEAISQFQESAKDPGRKISSLNMLGLCFKEKNMLDLAAAQFKKALSMAPEISDKTKYIIYNLGCTYEKMEQFSEAINEFKKIYEVDINYKDVSQKIEQTYRNKE